jgi:DNA-binding Lrp family transcriptional regulator
MSHITRFFDCTRLLKRLFSIETEDDTTTSKEWFHENDQVELSEKERKVYTVLVEHPEATTQQLGDIVGLSRHTISRMKKQFFNEGLLQQIVLPDLQRLGIEILAFYHIKFNPHKAPRVTDIAYLDSPFTILLAQRKFEMVLLAAYPTFQDYKEDEMQKIRFLKENDFISYTPLVGTYMFGRMVVIKDFDFASLTKKILTSFQ